jgi:peptide/nickel transport system substrate-binding protein
MAGRVILFLLLLLLVGCAPGVERQISSEKRVVYGLTLKPTGIDPHIHRSSELGIPLRQVYDTLIYREPNSSTFVPGLAVEWSISPDGLIYTFNLRDDVTFHDGTPFNAMAVAANLDRITNPETLSERAVFMLGPYRGYEIVDNYTIRILLNEPYSPLLDSLAQVYLGVASPAALNEYSNNRYQFHQVGTGPFTFVEYVPHERLVIRRNPDYTWGPSFYSPPDEHSVTEIEFRFFDDPPTRVLALESDEAQIMGEILPTDARLLTGNSTIQLTPTSIPGQPLQFLMNTRNFPTDTRVVRQALLLGTNRNAIIDAVFQGFSPVAWGPITASTLYYDRDMNGLYVHDINQARGLLESQGYRDTNNDGFVDVAGITIEVTVIVPPWGLIPQVAELMQDQWRTIGIKTVLRPVPTLTALRESVNRGDYNLVAFNTAGIDPAFLNDFFLSNGNLNWTGFSSADLDSMLLQASRETDGALRRNLYAQIQRAIMNEALILPIRDYVNINAQSASLQSLEFDPYGWFPLLHNLRWTSN